MGAGLGRALHVLVPGTNEVVIIAAFMAAANTGVTKTPLGSALVVSEMSGLRMLPTTLIATIVAFALTGHVGLIHTQHGARHRRTGTRPPVATWVPGRPASRTSAVSGNVCAFHEFTSARSWALRFRQAM